MRKAVRAIGLGLQLVPMWILGAYLLFATTLLITMTAAGRSRTGFGFENQSAIEFWYGLVIVVVGVAAIRWFKAAVLEALIAGIPIALLVAGRVSDRADFLDRQLVEGVAVFCAISLVGFAIRVLATPGPADKPQVSSLT